MFSVFIFAIALSTSITIAIHAETRDTGWSGYARENGLFETAISRLGSRFVINPRPQDGEWHISPMGTYFGQPGKMVLALEAGGIIKYLPFAQLEPLCNKTTQKLTPASISYTCEDPELPADITFTFLSPFSPGDEMISIGPYFIMNISVSAKKSFEGKVWMAYSQQEKLKTGPFSSDKLSGIRIEGSWVGHHEKGDSPEDQRKPIYASDKKATMIWASGKPSAGSLKWFGKTPRDKNFPDRSIGFCWDMKADAGSTIASPEIIMSAFVSRSVLFIGTASHYFKYKNLFKDAEDVAAWVASNKNEIHKKNSEFEKRMSAESKKVANDAFLPLTSFAFHSWIMNSWWTTGKDGKEWFSVWEGICKGHSTLDVAYNEGPAYLELWPELLRLQLYEWPDYRRYPNIMPHDMGFGMSATAQAMKHDMPIEENTNFILLLGAYWKETGDEKTVKDLWPVVQKLVDYMIAVDEDGNGFADEGTANTIDSGIPATQYAPELTYIAVKTLSALKYVTLMADIADDQAIKKRSDEFIGRITHTLKTRAWLGDHFAVTLHDKIDFRDPRGHIERDENGKRIWDGEDDSHTVLDGFGGPLKGWNAHSIYAPNGLYYLMRYDIPLPVDSELLGMFKTDLENAVAATLQKYGSTHTDAESTLWISQNIWQDMIAAYFGIDLRERLSRYYDFEKEVNQRPIYPSHEGGCFTDTYHYGSDSFGLEYYPRGAALFGLPGAWENFGSVKTGE